MARHPELLIPASSLEVLKTAVIFGADAVYIGGEAFGLRAKAKNFSMEDMKKGIAFAHEHDVKVYVTANILAHNEDLPGVRKYFEELKEIKPDALIIADPGVFEIAKEVCPEIERHISTQANNTNYGTYNFWYKQGSELNLSRRTTVFRMHPHWQSIPRQEWLSIQETLRLTTHRYLEMRSICSVLLRSVRKACWH